MCQTAYTAGVDDKNNDVTQKGEVNKQQNPGDDGEACATNAVSLGWALCPIIDLFSATAKSIERKIVLKELKINTDRLKRNSAENGIYALWKQVRLLANVLFVLIFLFIITANALSFSISNYTIKKMLPRLIAAAILVQASFLLCSILVDIGNVLGGGFEALINAVLLPTIGNSGGDSGIKYGIGIVVDIITVGAAGAAAAIAAVSVPGVLFLALSVVCGLIAMFVTLVVRQLVVAILIVISPLAFASWVLPGTSKFFSTWSKNFVRLILMYPLIVIFLGMSSILSAATAHSGLDSIIAALYPIIAFFAIPFTFKFAGGILSTAGSAVMRRGSGVGGGLQRSQIAKDLTQQSREKGLEKYATADGRTGRFLGGIRSGTLIPSRTSNRRMLGQFAKATNDRIPGLNEQFQRMKKEDVQAVAEGESRPGISSSPISQIAALRHLEFQGNYEGLRAAKGKLGNDSKIWNAAETPMYSELKQKAPDLIAKHGADPYDFVNKLTPAALSEMHHTTATRIVEHIGTLQGGNATEKAEAKTKSAALALSFQGIADSQQLRNKTKKDVVKAFADGAIGNSNFANALDQHQVDENSNKPGGPTVSALNLFTDKTHGPGGRLNKNTIIPPA